MSKFKSFTKEMRKRLGTDVKGFTLIEVIVVLVILAILMAIAIPNVLGYINKAKGTENELNARNVFMAAQVETSELLKENKYITANTFAPKNIDAIKKLANIAAAADVKTVDESAVTPAAENTGNDPVIRIVINKNAISGVQYVPGQTGDEDLETSVVNYHANGSINYGKAFNKTAPSGGSSESK